jgi:hypothetical protein
MQVVWERHEHFSGKTCLKHRAGILRRKWLVIIKLDHSAIDYEHRGG